MAARSFTQVVKDLTVGDVHVGGGLSGGDGKKRRARLFSAVVGGKPKTVETSKSEPSWTSALDVKKIDADQRQVFGWASVVTKAGVPLVDHQGDVIDVSDLAKAAYDFVLFSREGGDMHAVRGASRCIESMVFDKAKQDALGIDLGQEGWWVGFQIENDAVWAAHKRGERPEFSIGGVAVPVEM